MKNALMIGAVFLVAWGICSIYADTSPPTRNADIACFQYHWNDYNPAYSLVYPVTPGASIDEDFIISVSTLPPGPNILHIRAVSSDGIPGIPFHKWFYKSEEEEMFPVSSLEYWIDDDPGVGNATTASFNHPSTDVQQPFLVSIFDYSVGLYQLGFRVKNTNDEWSQTFYRRIYRPPVPLLPDVVNITGYFVDQDGNATDSYDISVIDPDSLIIVAGEFPLTDLSEGNNYKLHVYVTSSEDIKSQEYITPLTVNWTPSEPISEIDGLHFTFSWGAVIGADYYEVYGLDEPGGVSVLLGTTTETHWTDPEPTSFKRFYYVVAVCS